MRVSITTLLVDIKEFKRITTAGASTAAVTENIWREYVLVVSRSNFKFRRSEIQRCQKHGLRSFKSLLFSVSQRNGSPKGQWPLFQLLGRTDYF